MEYFMKSYLLQGNVIKLLRLNYPEYEKIKEETWRTLIKSESILQDGITAGHNYDGFVNGVKKIIKNNDFYVLQHRLSPYVDNDIFANENDDSHNDFMVFSSLEVKLLDIVKDDDSFNRFIEYAGRSLNKNNTIRNVNIRTVPEADGSYTEFLDVDFLSLELGLLRAFILNKSKENKLLCAIIASVFLMHIHPLSDGNGRVSRVLFNVVLERDAENYIPITELCHIARSGYVLSLREAFLFLDWESIIIFYCKCIDLIHNSHEFK